MNNYGAHSIFYTYIVLPNAAYGVQYATCTYMHLILPMMLSRIVAKKSRMFIAKFMSQLGNALSLEHISTFSINVHPCVALTNSIIGIEISLGSLERFRN